MPAKTKQKDGGGAGLPRRPLKESDVNSALLQQVAEELDIGVPIWGWGIVGGRLLLHLAYGGQAFWPPDALTEREGELLKKAGQNVSRDDVPVLGEDYDWSNPTSDPLPEIPESLKGLLKRDLERLADAHGFRVIRPGNFKKVEYLLALDRRREALRGGE